MGLNSKDSMKTMENKLKQTLSEVKKASREASNLSASLKKKILLDAAKELTKQSAFLISENRKDLKRAEIEGLSPAMIDRLTLNEERIKLMAEGVKTVARLEEPVGKVLRSWIRPNGLKISKVSVPLGVILIIYESRPNVTVECASLCLKSGNAVLLRGGKEAYNSNAALAGIFSKTLRANGVSPSCVSLVETTDRKAVDFLLLQDADINLVIPRGGESLIRKVAEISRIPVIKHYKGVCHVFVDDSADLEKALDIAYNAKMQRTGVCNAMETLLVHKRIAHRFLPLIGERLKTGGCEVRGDKETTKLIPWAVNASEEDFGKEWLDKILSIKVVKSVDEAINHISCHGSGHTDAIITKSGKNAKNFAKNVDSSSVMVNASTRFADGFEYGFGGEIGISTDKIHARGPMGLEGLTTYKYVVEGDGHVRR